METEEVKKTDVRYVRSGNGELVVVVPVDITDQDKTVTFHHLISKEEEEQEEDPYLQPGWPCEVDRGDGVFSLKYYNETIDKNTHCFVAIKDNVGKVHWEGSDVYTRSYRPIGTEWDFAPGWADKLKITVDGECIFKEVDDVIDEWHTHIKTVLPPEYYGQTISRPEWAYRREDE
jgi:hypothetical protein